MALDVVDDKIGVQMGRVGPRASWLDCRAAGAAGAGEPEIVHVLAAAGAAERVVVIVLATLEVPKV